MGCGASKPPEGGGGDAPIKKPSAGGKGSDAMTISPPSAGYPVFGGPESAAEMIHRVDGYGSHRFRGKVAAPFLKQVGLKPDILEDLTWTHREADKVAKAVMEWAKSLGAGMVTHWFQPMGSSGVRFGQTGQVHNAMFNFGENGKVEWQFNGGDLLKGETDGSSYLNGGMRATHTAGGYTALDPSSPMFVRGDTLFIPTVFVSFYGRALDEKTPLLRAMQAVSKAGSRLLKALGHNCKTVLPMIGLEQEFFLIPRDAYYGRPDLQLTGRSILGKSAPRGQELCDHYMAPLNPIALACMQEMQHEAFKLGIPLKTRHREVAPNQYECAPFFGLASSQIDENLVVMELMESIATKHGLACLLHEKPFPGVNGSGKHNNFSLSTDGGLNLFNAPQMNKVTGNPLTFPVIMAAVVQAVDKHGDLLRMAIASPGNDFRLGACEAPPAIMSTYLGASLTEYLEEFKSTKVAKEYAPAKKEVELNIAPVAPFTVPAEDRNRTSPFPYGGHRFEFRAVGSSQNVSMVNTVLCSAIADAFTSFADAIDGGKSPQDTAAEALEAHWRVIFNGNGYSAEWPPEAGERGLWRIDSGVEAVQRLIDPKNLGLFASLQVMTEEETTARCEVMHEQYWGTVEMEANCMLEMIATKVLPACKESGAVPATVISGIESGAASVKEVLARLLAAESGYAKATVARELRLETLEEVRKLCDEAEGSVPAGSWPIPSYKELLFLDFNQGTP